MIVEHVMKTKNKWSKNNRCEILFDAVKFQGKLFQVKSSVGIKHLYASS